MDQLKKRGGGGGGGGGGDHLLIHCPSMWGLWSGPISIPGLHWVSSRLAKDLLSGWKYFPISKKTKRVWRAAPLSLFWQSGRRETKLSLKMRLFA